MRRIRDRFWRLFDLKLHPLKVVLFNIITGCGFLGGLAALMISSAIRVGVDQIVAIALAELLLLMSFYFINCRDRLEAAVVLISLIALVDFPWMFFMGGGVRSGMPFWFVMGIVFTFLLAEGRLLVGLTIVELIVYTGCFLVDFYYPQYTTPILTRGGQFVDVWQSMVCLGLVIGSISVFHGRVHRKMHVQDMRHRQELEQAQTELTAAREAYKKLAYTDFMTGLYNRTAFENELLRLKREPARPDVCFIVADLNRLKEINDRRGHEAGDSAIRCAGRMLAQSFGSDCRCYRIGGDEFCVISETMTAQQARERVESFSRSMEHQEVAAGWPLSMAVGWHMTDSLGYDGAFRAADQAMYRCKVEMNGART